MVFAAACLGMFAFLAVAVCQGAGAAGSADEISATAKEADAPALIRLADCRRLFSEQRFLDADDVAPADYVPGEDVYGAPVVPAEGPDADASVFELPFNHVSLDIAVDLDERYPRRFRNGVEVGSLPVGYLTIRGGHAYFHQRPLSPEQFRQLKEACHGAFRHAP